MICKMNFGKKEENKKYDDGKGPLNPEGPNIVNQRLLSLPMSSKIINVASSLYTKVGNKLYFYEIDSESQ